MRGHHHRQRSSGDFVDKANYVIISAIFENVSGYDPKNTGATAVPVLAMTAMAAAWTAAAETPAWPVEGGGELRKRSKTRVYATNIVVIVGLRSHARGLS